MAIDPNIKKKADDIRNKIYGKEVRESLASGLEAMSSDVVETVGRQDEVESQWQNVVDETTGKDVISAPEIIAARNGESNLKARLDKEHQKVAARTQITPDDFDGTDIEKLQQVFDYAIENNIETIELTRSYDVTGGSIYFPEDSYFPFKLLVFRGGEIIKNDAGYVFDCVADNNSRNSPQFSGTNFTTETEAETCLYNGDKMIRQSVTNSLFDRMGLVHTNDYLQTVRVINCETGQLNADFIYGKMAFDFEMAFHKGESSTKQGKHLINIKTDGANDISFMSLRILDSLIEGYSNNAPILLGTGYGLKIDGLYCEANKTSVRFERGVGTDRLSGSISNAIFSRSLGDFDIEFDGIANYTFLKLSNITSNIPSSKTMTNSGSPRLKTDNMNLYSGGKVARNTRSYKQYSTYPVTQQDLGSGGISFEVPLQTSNYGPLHSQINKQFLFNAMFTYAGSVHYSAHLTGILSMDGYHDGEVVYGLNVDVLSTRNTSGANNGNLGNNDVFDYYFKESGTKTLSSNTTTATVVFKFENGVYNNEINVNNLTFKPINELVSEGMIDV